MIHGGICNFSQDSIEADPPSSTQAVEENLFPRSRTRNDLNSQTDLMPGPRWEFARYQDDPWMGAGDDAWILSTRQVQLQSIEPPCEGKHGFFIFCPTFWNGIEGFCPKSLGELLKESRKHIVPQNPGHPCMEYTWMGHKWCKCIYIN